jgi:hypothetical protein
MGWGGVENGELLRRAASAGFDAVLTKDAGVQYDLNLTNLPLAVVILHAPSNGIDDIRPPRYSKHSCRCGRMRLRT